jgi:hypothetical protein
MCGFNLHVIIKKALVQTGFATGTYGVTSSSFTIPAVFVTRQKTKMFSSNCIHKQQKRLNIDCY